MYKCDFFSNTFLLIVAESLPLPGGSADTAGVGPPPLHPPRHRPPPLGPGVPEGGLLFPGQQGPEGGLAAYDAAAQPVRIFIFMI